MPTLAFLNLLPGLVSLVYPRFCTICSHPVVSGESLCTDCAGHAPRLHAPFCAKCSQPFSGDIDGSFTCANCMDRVLHFVAAVSAYRSRGVVRQVIHQFKYGRQTHLRHVIGGWVAAALDDSRLASQRFDLIVPVPLHPARQRERGFNQAQLLAEALHQRSGIPLAHVLQRTRYTTTQTQFDRSERMENLRGAFRLRRSSDVRGLRMLLVDDVLTTGSTLSECACILRRGGAISVYAATAARG